MSIPKSAMMVAFDEVADALECAGAEVVERDDCIVFISGGRKFEVSVNCIE